MRVVSAARPRLAGLLLAALAPSCWALEILRWERLPLAVPLVVGQERVVFIERNVRVGVSGALGQRLRVQSAGGALYLSASEPFEPTRLQVQDTDSGALILLDVRADPARPGQAPLEPVRIVEGNAPARSADSQPSPSESAEPARKTAQETPIPVVLTRHAAQNLYAPLRTIEPVPGISRVNLPGDLAIDTLLPQLPIRAKALAAWRMEDHWVTAVRLTNTSARRIELDPRSLQGHFIAATFQHADLGPAGHPTDTTVVYLVTRGHGLTDALLPRISPIDASRNLPAQKGNTP